MENSQERSVFPVKQIAEQKPFETFAVQSFFREWCVINDSIEPEYLDRKEWEEKTANGVLQKKPQTIWTRKKFSKHEYFDPNEWEEGPDNTLQTRPHNIKTLFIPKDIQLWEMVGIMETVDNDTFAEKPERRTQKKEQLVKLGTMFQDAASYIAKRIDAITEGKAIAEALAQEFYSYGQSLVIGQNPESEISLETIAQTSLSKEQTEEVDQWLAGEAVYTSRQRKAEKTTSLSSKSREDIFEIERRKTLAQFFRMTEKAFSRQQGGGNQEAGLEFHRFYGDKNTYFLTGALQKTPIYASFLRKVEGQITKAIETPRRELEDAMLRRGMEKMLNEMREKGWRETVNNFYSDLGIDFKFEQRRLYDALNVPKLKQELSSVRQTGNLAKISKKEKEIALKIQKAINTFPYNLDASNPSKIISTQSRNCVGASAMGAAFLSEVGIDYLVVGVIGHSILSIATSDGKMILMDMLMPNKAVRELTDGEISGKTTAGRPITVTDIVSLSHGLLSEPLVVDVTAEWYKTDFPADDKWWLENVKSTPPSSWRQFIEFYPPETGLKLHILGNMADSGIIGLEGERHHFSIHPHQNFTASMANRYFVTGHYEQAVNLYRRALRLEPTDAHPVIYYYLGQSLRQLGRAEEATESFVRAVDLDPNKAADYL